MKKENTLTKLKKFAVHVLGETNRRKNNDSWKIKWKAT